LLLWSVGLEATASLLVAGLDLKLVQLLRGAMRAADAASGKCFPVAFIGPAPNCDLLFIRARRVIDPTPRILPRVVIRPTPRILPRPVIHPTARFEPPPSPVPACPEQPPRCGHGLPPPWKSPAWNIPIPPKPTIKRIVHRTDVRNKGSLIDLFC